MTVGRPTSELKRAVRGNAISSDASAERSQIDRLHTPLRLARGLIRPRQIVLGYGRFPAVAHRYTSNSLRPREASSREPRQPSNEKTRAIALPMGTPESHPRESHVGKPLRIGWAWTMSDRMPTLPVGLRREAGLGSGLHSQRERDIHLASRSWRRGSVRVHPPQRREQRRVAD